LLVQRAEARSLAERGQTYLRSTGAELEPRPKRDRRGDKNLGDGPGKPGRTVRREPHHDLARNHLAGRAAECILRQLGGPMVEGRSVGPGTKSQSVSAGDGRAGAIARPASARAPARPV